MTDLASKTALRRHALARRDLIEPAEAHAAAEEIVGRALEIVGKLAPAGAVVSAYWPIRSEISTRPLLEALAQAGYRIALPVMTAAAKPLHFRLWAPGSGGPTPSTSRARAAGSRGSTTWRSRCCPGSRGWCR